MRKGINPEKIHLNKVEYKPHRIIIPVYIPDNDEPYFKYLFDVFELSINSLLSSINPRYTNITIINNNSNEKTTNFINSLLTKKLIDKHVHYKTNYGKTYTLLVESRGLSEKWLTIADADVYYYQGWLENSLKLFNIHSRIGVVSPQPMPNLAFYNNYSLFSNFLIKKKIGNYVNSQALDLFETSIDDNNFFNKWKKNQIIIEKNKIIACAGAGHFIATYKSSIFNFFPLKFPIYLFKKGDINIYIDDIIDILGFYRVSTLDSYVYHMGNIPEYPPYYINEKEENKPDFSNISHEIFGPSKIPFFVRKSLGRIEIELFKRKLNDEY